MFGNTVGQQFVNNSVFARAESTFNTRQRLNFDSLTKLSESPSLGDSPSGFLNRRTNTLSLRLDTENVREGEKILFMIEAFSADSPIRRTARFTNDDIQFCSRYMDNSSVYLSGFGTNNSPNTYNQVSSLLNGVEPFAVIVTFGGIPFMGSGRDTLILICLKLSDTFLIGLVVIIF